MFIAKHRRFSRHPGCGVQYIPGHIEPFVDLVIREYLPDEGSILDLGGGGLRFAIPVALTGRSITVVDLDGSAIEVDDIVDRVNNLEGTDYDTQQLSELITGHESAALDFLRETTKRYEFISIFRVAHFFSAEDFIELFRLAHQALRPGGLFVVSGMTPYNLPGETDFNEIYRYSEALKSSNPLVRKFTDRPKTMALRKEQNLPEYIHLVDSSFISTQADEQGFEIVVDGYQSTRIVAGYILRRLES